MGKSRQENKTTVCALFCIALELSSVPCLVVGGGTVAVRRVNSLLTAGARVRVVCLEAAETLIQQAAVGEIVLHTASYSSEYLHGAQLVFAATSSRSVNAAIAADCRARGIHVNVADSPQQGDFVVPAQVRRGPLCLAVTTGGAQPRMTARIAEQLQQQYGPEYGPALEILGQLRQQVLQAGLSAQKKKEALLFLESAWPAILQNCAGGRHYEAEQQAAGELQKILNSMKLETDNTGTEKPCSHA